MSCIHYVGNELGHLILLRVTSSGARDALDVFFFFPLKGMRDKGVVRGTRPSIQETRGREPISQC